MYAIVEPASRFARNFSALQPFRPPRLGGILGVIERRQYRRSQNGKDLQKSSELFRQHIF